MIMKPEEVLYTDGHDVTVTYSAIQVRKKWYSLNGITKHGLTILSPIRISSILLILTGLALSLVGLFNIAPRIIGVSDFTVLNVVVQVSQLSFWFGVLLLSVALLHLLMIHEKYAISITTAEGERNVVISTHKEYIMQILKALNTAYLTRVGLTSAAIRRKKKN